MKYIIVCKTHNNEMLFWKKWVGDRAKPGWSHSINEYCIFKQLHYAIRILLKRGSSYYNSSTTVKCPDNQITIMQINCLDNEYTSDEITSYELETVKDLQLLIDQYISRTKKSYISRRKKILKKKISSI